MIGLWRVPTISSRLGGVSLAWIGFVALWPLWPMPRPAAFFSRARAPWRAPATHDRAKQRQDQDFVHTRQNGNSSHERSIDAIAVVTPVRQREDDRGN